MHEWQLVVVVCSIGVCLAESEWDRVGALSGTYKVLH